jgi:hypothetical protein
MRLLAATLAALGEAAATFERPSGPAHKQLPADFDHRGEPVASGSRTTRARPNQRGRMPSGPQARADAVKNVNNFRAGSSVEVMPVRDPDSDTGKALGGVEPLAVRGRVEDRDPGPRSAG